MKKNNQTYLLIGGLVVLLMAGYYLFYSLPAKEKMNAEAVKYSVELKRLEAVENEKKDRADCSQEANDRAMELIKWRSEKFGVYKDTAKAGGYLVVDYDKALKDCYNRKGLAFTTE